MNEVYCKDCGKIHVEGEVFAKHEDGTILCKTCFDKRVAKGDIE
jgi:formylmethanofuran dehydrogenase subunit E